MKKMMSLRFLFIGACTVALAGCAHAVPTELSNARSAYQRTSEGPAAKLVPADVHKAQMALSAAEKSFADAPESFQTRDLAYVAWRTCEMADAQANIAADQGSTSRAKDNLSAMQGDLVEQTKADLATSKHTGELTAEKLSAEQDARIAADKRATDAQAALAKLAAVKDEPRGMVITLSGSVLFASNKTDLLPEARTRLDQVAEVLLTTRERNITVEGYTDSQGSDSFNMDLSQRRADAVRSYLVQRGYQADRIQAHGLGKGSPVADNASAEGRANNRRVEIVIQRDAQARVGSAQ